MQAHQGHGGLVEAGGAAAFGADGGVVAVDVERPAPTGRLTLLAGLGQAVSPAAPWRAGPQEHYGHAHGQSQAAAGFAGIVEQGGAGQGGLYCSPGAEQRQHTQGVALVTGREGVEQGQGGRGEQGAAAAGSGGETRGQSRGRNCPAR